MDFWNLKTLRLDEFRPAIFSKVEQGSTVFVPAGIRHGWKAAHPSAEILEVVLKK